MATGGFQKMMNSLKWQTKIKDQESEIKENNKCMNCKIEGHKHWECPKEDICRICKREGHIARDCPTSRSCKYCNKKGHPEHRCFNKPEEIKNKEAKDKGTEEGGQEGSPQNTRGDWHQWAPQKALREAMAKKNKRIVVTMTTECEGEKRKPTMKEIKRVLMHRKIDTKKVVGVITRIDRAEVFFEDDQTAESFLFEFALKAGPDIWATSARFGSNNIKKVIFKKVSWNINDDTILKYASIWGTPQPGKDGRYITYEKESVEEEGTKWLTGNRLILMSIKQHIPRKNIIQGCMVAVDYPGQQECFKCKDTPDKCPGKGKARDCNLSQTSWKDRLRERLKALNYDLSEMEVGGEEEAEAEDVFGLDHLTEEPDEDKEKLEKDEHLEEIKVIGMKNIEKEVLWELIKGRMKKAEEEIGNNEIEDALENKKEEFENASVVFEPFKGRPGWGNMVIKSEDDDLLRGLWMGILLMRDALEIKLVPKYKNSQTTPTKKKIDKEITNMEKLQIEIKAIEAGLKKKEKNRKKGQTTPDPIGDTLNPDENQPHQGPPYGGARRKDRNQPSKEPLGKTEVDENKLLEETIVDENGTIRDSQPKERGARCGKCKFCKYECGTCEDCTEMIRPDKRRKACRKRGPCKSPRPPSRTPSVSRNGEEIDQDVKSKIKKLENLETEIRSSLVAVTETG